MAIMYCEMFDVTNLNWSDPSIKPVFIECGQPASVKIAGKWYCERHADECEPFNAAAAGEDFWPDEMDEF